MDLIYHIPSKYWTQEMTSLQSRCDILTGNMMRSDRPEDFAEILEKAQEELIKCKLELLESNPEVKEAAKKAAK